MEGLKPVKGGFRFRGHLLAPGWPALAAHGIDPSGHRAGCKRWWSQFVSNGCNRIWQFVSEVPPTKTMQLDNLNFVPPNEQAVMYFKGFPMNTTCFPLLQLSCPCFD